MFYLGFAGLCLCNLPIWKLFKVILINLKLCAKVEIHVLCATITSYIERLLNLIMVLRYISSVSADFRGISCCIHSWCDTSPKQKQLKIDIFFILNDKKQSVVCVVCIGGWVGVIKGLQIAVLFPSWLHSVCFKIFPSRPMEVNALSPDRTKEKGLSTLKAFSHCETNLLH